MHKSGNNDNNNKDTSKMQYFASNAWLLWNNNNNNTLKANPALCKHSTIKANAQIMWGGGKGVCTKNASPRHQECFPRHFPALKMLPLTLSSTKNASSARHARHLPAPILQFPGTFLHQKPIPRQCRYFAAPPCHPPFKLGTHIRGVNWSNFGEFFFLVWL